MAFTALYKATSMVGTVSITALYKTASVVGTVVITALYKATSVEGTMVNTSLYKNSKYDQEIPQSQTTDNPMAPQGRASEIITRHQEHKLSKATSFLFPSKMIAILEWT